MPEATLRQLLERNVRHTDSLPSGYFDEVEREQHPPVVSICCSDSRVSQEGMFDVDRPGWLFTPSTIGNQVWDRHDGDVVVDGSLLYPIAFTDTGVTVVVGHTGCGAVTAALEAVRSGEGTAATDDTTTAAGDSSDGTASDADATPPGVAKWIDLLAPVVEDGLADDRVDPDREVSLVDQLVEYNVDRQVSFLLDSEEVPAEETIYGFVYDFQGVYGDIRGRTYLVNADDETDPAALASLAEPFGDHARRLL